MHFRKGDRRNLSPFLFLVGCPLQATPGNGRPRGNSLQAKNLRILLMNLLLSLVKLKKVSSSVQFHVAHATRRYSKCGAVPPMQMRGGIRYFRPFISWGRKLQNGKVDEKGNIDSHSTIYHTVFGDESGKPTLHVWSATHVISDNRIPPKGQKEEHFVCLIPTYVKFPLKTKTVLHYRSAPQDVVDALLVEKSIKLPIIDMAEASTEINL